MKTKKLQKKLSLNKNTIVDLHDHEMRSAKGGTNTMCCPTDASINSCEVYCDTIEQCTLSCTFWTCLGTIC